jgi:hypothetical protein
LCFLFALLLLGVQCMFITTLLRDTVSITPSKFSIELADVIQCEIEMQYLNKASCQLLAMLATKIVRCLLAML